MLKFLRKSIGGKLSDGVQSSDNIVACRLISRDVKRIYHQLGTRNIFGKGNAVAVNNSSTRGLSADNADAVDVRRFCILLVTDDLQLPAARGKQEERAQGDCEGD